MRVLAPPLRGSAFLAIALVVVAACQPLAQPFQPQKKSLAPSQLSALGPRSGIVVVAPTGAGPEVTARLPARVAAALLERKIPATAKANPSQRFALRSEVKTHFGSNDTAEITVRWTLRNPQGSIFAAWDQYQSAEGAAWRLADPRVIDTFAATAAEELASRIGPGVLGPSRATALADPVSLAILPINGAPGDGNVSLTHALANTLRGRGIDVEPLDQNVAFFISGSVSISAVNGGERVDVVWWLLRSDGQEVGMVDQSNVLAVGALDGPWKDLAYAIAEGAADGILALLERPEPSTIRASAN